MLKILILLLVLSGSFGARVALAAAPPANLLSALGTQNAPISEMKNGSPGLARAHDDVEQHRWAEAATELEGFEAGLLSAGDRSTSGVLTNPSREIAYVIAARSAVNDQNQIDALLNTDEAQNASGGSTWQPLAVVVQTTTSVQTVKKVLPPGAPCRPIVTKAMLPGHWKLTDWKYHWVPPDGALRPVQANPFIPGHYEFHDGDWQWVAGHYGQGAG